MNERCIWHYRPAIIKGEHFAIASCDKKQKYLSKIRGDKQRIGCADCYEWLLCPSCGKPIQMDYSVTDFDQIEL